MALDAYANRLRKEEWFVKDVTMGESKLFIEQHHYAKGCSHTRVYSHGLFCVHNPKEIMGVALWLPPTKVAAQSVNIENWRRVLSLSLSSGNPPFCAKKMAQVFCFPRASRQSLKKRSGSHS